MSFPVPHSFCSCPLIGLNEQKARGGKRTIPNSNVGKESISQTISALEHWRASHAYLYQDIPQANKALHGDWRIKTIEAAKKHDEPKRIASSQALKAAGTSSGELFLCLLSLCHADDLPPLSETPTQRQNLCAVPPGACRTVQDHSKSILVFGMQPCCFSPPQQLCVVAAVGSCIGQICLCLTSP